MARQAKPGCAEHYRLYPGRHQQPANLHGDRNQRAGADFDCSRSGSGGDQRGDRGGRLGHGREQLLVHRLGLMHDGRFDNDHLCEPDLVGGLGLWIPGRLARRRRVARRGTPHHEQIDDIEARLLHSVPKRWLTRAM